MKNAIGLTFFLLSFTAVFASTSATVADAPLPAPNSAKANSRLKKVSTPSVSAKATTMNPVQAVIPPANPTVKVLSLAEGREAEAEAALGQKYLDAGDLDAAEAEFVNSVKLNHRDPAALAGLAQTFDQEGKGKQAIAVYRYLLYPKTEMRSSMEQDPILRMRFALLLAGDGQWKEAVYVYESTINTVTIGYGFPRLDVHFSPDVVQLSLFQAMCHLALGVVYNGRTQNTQALADYTAALSEQPNLALAHYLDGHGLRMLGRYPEAQAAFRKAAQLDQSGDGAVKAAAEEELSR